MITDTNVPFHLLETHSPHTTHLLMTTPPRNFLFCGFLTSNLALLKNVIVHLELRLVASFILLSEISHTSFSTIMAVVM